MNKKKLEIEKHIVLNDARLMASGKKTIKTKNNLAKILKAKFPKNKNLAKSIYRLESEPFLERYNRDLVEAVCEILNVCVSEIMVDAE